jgi:hypothetical protein
MRVLMEELSSTGLSQELRGAREAGGANLEGWRERVERVLV